MNPAFRFFLAATGISLMSMIDSALAGSAVEGVEAADKVILEAGEIDSSTVPVGSYVVVIHGQGERHPVSGEWEQFVTSRGYVHAVDAKVLTLFRKWDGEPEWIALERIQALVMMGPPPRGAEAGGRSDPVEPISRQAKSSSLRQGNGASTTTRVVRKLAAGAIGGALGGLVGFGTGVAAVQEDCEGGDTFCGLGTALSGLFFGTIGYTSGIVAGVTIEDPHDSTIVTLIGSTAGLGIGLLTAEPTKGWSLLTFPIVYAVTMSEMSRKPPQSSRFSVGLNLNPEEGLSAVAFLRF